VLPKKTSALPVTDPAAVVVALAWLVSSTKETLVPSVVLAPASRKNRMTVPEDLER
jgi:hypothetical protein